MNGNKNSSYQSNFVLIPGQIHVQLHYEDHMGHAFDIDDDLPLNIWIQLVLTVIDTSVHVFYKYGKNLDKRGHFVHDS